MSPSVILGLCASLIIFAVLFEMMRRHHLREKYAVLWFLVAFGALVVSVAPGLLAWAARVAGVEVPANLVFFLASMLLLALSLQHSFELGRLEERTRTLAEEVALLQLRVEQQSVARDGETAGDQSMVADPTERRAINREPGEDQAR